MRSAISGSIATALLLSSALSLAEGAPPQPPVKARLSGYERTALENALARVKGEVDPSPTGKIVESIAIVPFEVFEKRDFIPEIFLGFVNWFHVTTKPYVIEREVLLTPGQLYNQAFVDETARNLRNTRQVSLVLVTPVLGSAPDRVKILVVTKDIWSLRLNSDYRFAGGRLEYLFLEPSEENVFGTHQSLFATFQMRQDTYSFGGRYTIPRVAGSRIQAALSAGVILNRATGLSEGSYGSFTYGQPVYATKATWAWEGAMSWRHEIVRRYIGSKPRTFDSTTTPDDDAIPFVYGSDALSGRYEVTRSFGVRNKNNVTVGIRANRNVYRTGDLSSFAAPARDDFLGRAVPVSDTQIGPYFQLHSFVNRYITVLDFNTLGLQEDFIAGHDAYLKISPVATALGSSRSFLGVYASAAYTIPLGDGLARAYVELTNELTTSGIPDGSIDVGVRFTTPRTPVGRLHFDARVLDRYANYLNARSSLGGDSRPRGYPSGAFIGKDVIAATLEYRSRAAQILGCQLGGALFFDAGDAADGFDQMRIKQSAGFGVRVLFPQFDRVVMRADWGFPLTRGVVPTGGFPGDIVVTFRQAFPMPALPAAN